MTQLFAHLNMEKKQFKWIWKLEGMMRVIFYFVTVKFNQKYISS